MSVHCIVGLKTHNIGRTGKYWHGGTSPDVASTGSVSVFEMCFFRFKPRARNG